MGVGGVALLVGRFVSRWLALLWFGVFSWVGWGWLILCWVVLHRVVLPGLALGGVGLAWVGLALVVLGWLCCVWLCFTALYARKCCRVIMLFDIWWRWVGSAWVQLRGGLAGVEFVVLVGGTF